MAYHKSQITQTHICNMSFPYTSIVGASWASTKFPFARDLYDTINNRPPEHEKLTCRGRCSEEIEKPELQRLNCKCDQACLFLGDCCFDYLYECGERPNRDFESNLAKQSAIYRRFRPYWTCRSMFAVDMRNHTLRTMLRLVDTCPPDSLPYQNSLCAGHKRTISYYIPAISNGVLFLNIYCAACHGIPWEDIWQVVQNNDVRCTVDDSDDRRHPSQLLRADIRCQHALLWDYSGLLDRYGASCECLSDEVDVLIWDDCNEQPWVTECAAYLSAKNITGADGKPIAAKNEACSACFNRTKLSEKTEITCADYANPRGFSTNHESLFDFTGLFEMWRGISDCSPLHHNILVKGTCLRPMCQVGYTLSENRCMPLLSEACMVKYIEETKFKMLEVDFSRPALVVLHEMFNARHMSVIGRKIKESGSPCHKLAKVYFLLMNENHAWSDRFECTVFYIDFSYYNYVANRIVSIEFVKLLIPDMKVHHIIAINHDPFHGLNCTEGIQAENVAYTETTSDGSLRLWQEGSDREYSSKSTTMVISVSSKSKVSPFILTCKHHKTQTECLPGKGNTSVDLLARETCPKFELIGVLPEPTGRVRLGQDFMLNPAEYMTTANHSVLVCVETYESLFRPAGDKSRIIVSTCYSISLLCLLLTFLVYAGFRSLRTLPGLMLMNLILALFLAQLLYVLNTTGLFHGCPIICRISATSQHYFWLVSFTWMACMSLDIFLCLAASYTTISNYNHSKLIKFMLVSWLVPLFIPILTNIFTTMSLFEIDYDSTELCWLSNARGVFFMFAIPVLIIVAINMTLFIGSVCRFCSLLQNAAFVGRKAEYKQRLVQCVKLASWMGISWFFGIVPNFWDVEVLWYMFATANALQGVHIFVAFALTGKARTLLRGRSSTRSMLPITKRESTSRATVSGEWTDGIN